MLKEFLISLFHSLLWSAIFLALVPYTIVKIFNVNRTENIYKEFTGFLLIFLGSFICLKAMYDLAKERATTTFLKRSKRLVKRGIYGRVRNPIYVGVLIILAGVFLLYPSVATFIYIILMFTGLHIWLVKVEEPLLRREFGKEFEEYKRDVPRWFCKLKRSS